MFFSFQERFKVSTLCWKRNKHHYLMNNYYKVKISLKFLRFGNETNSQFAAQLKLYEGNKVSY